MPPLRTKPAVKQVWALIATEWDVQDDNTIKLMDPYDDQQKVQLVSIVVRNNKISIVRMLNTFGFQVRGHWVNDFI
jgi:outer membrane protein TolC